MPTVIDTYTRRGFITKLAKDGAKVAIPLFLMNHLYGCAHDPFKQDPDDFTISNFDRWYKRNRLYNGPNPNLDGQRNMHTFKGAFPNGWTPGVSYVVSYGTTMVAVAPGEVIEVRRLNTGRAGGMLVIVGHPKFRSFTTSFAHLNAVYVHTGETVERGQPIGNLTQYTCCAKLMFSNTFNWIDPDTYGLEHDYMDYQENLPESFRESSYEETKEKNEIQSQIVFDFYTMLSSTIEIPLRYHKEKGYGACRWSYVDEFKYLSTLYKAKPDLFPGLTTIKVQSMTREFYDNQPIVLTLPFRKKA